MKIGLIIIGLCIILSAGAAVSSSPKQSEKPDYNGHFGDMDRNTDEGVDWKEFKVYFPHAEIEVFKKADSNRDQKIDHDEWHEYKEQRGYSHQEGYKH